MIVTNLAQTSRAPEPSSGDVSSQDQVLDLDKYAHGEFDGATGAPPEEKLWNDLSYRQGWLVGVAQYYDLQFAR